MKIYQVIQINEVEGYDTTGYDPDYEKKIVASFDNKDAAKEFIKLYNFPKIVNRYGFQKEMLELIETEISHSVDEVRYEEKYERQPIINAKYFSIRKGKFRIIPDERIKIEQSYYDDDSNALVRFWIEYNDNQHTSIELEFSRKNDMLWFSLFSWRKNAYAFFARKAGISMQDIKDAKTESSSFKKEDLMFYDAEGNPIHDWEKGIYYWTKTR